MGVLVVVPADAVADEALHDRETGPLDERLHRMRDVADAVSEPCLRDPGRERVLAHVQQALGVRLDRAHAEGVRAVRDRPFEGHADVDRHEVALVDDAPVRDAVDDDLVDRDADRTRVAAVPERGRDAAVLADERVREIVQLERGDAGPDPLADVRDRPPDEVAGARDPRDLGGSLADDHATASSSSSSSASAISVATCSIARPAWRGTSLPVAR